MSIAGWKFKFFLELTGVHAYTCLLSTVFNMPKQFKNR